MTKRNRIEVVEDDAAVPGGGPDLKRFKELPDDREAKDADRREKERLRARERRARAKGKSTTSADPVDLVDILTCHYVNAFLLNVAGVVTRRKVEASPEQYATLDASLQQIAAKYGVLFLKYASEIAFVTTFVVVVRSAPPADPAGEVEPGAEIGQQDRPDLGSEG